MFEWVQPVDDRVLHWFQEQHTPWLDYNLQQVTSLGSTTVLALLGFFVLGLLLLERQCKRVGLLIVLLLASYFATEALKDAVGRPRPVLGHSAKSTPSSASFPSSHASMAMTSFLLAALCLRDLWRRAGMPWAHPYVLLWGFGLAVVVGISRLYFGFHFFSDVVGGWALGVLCAVVFCGVDRITSRRAEVREEGTATAFVNPANPGG